MTLGKRIRKIRKFNNMTQEQFGKKLNLAKSTISQYESDTNLPDPNILRKISKEFNISADYILEISNIKTIKIDDLKEYLEDEHILNFIREFNKLSRKNQELVINIVEALKK